MKQKRIFCLSFILLYSLMIVCNKDPISMNHEFSSSEIIIPKQNNTQNRALVYNLWATGLTVNWENIYRTNIESITWQRVQGLAEKIIAGPEHVYCINSSGSIYKSASGTSGWSNESIYVNGRFIPAIDMDSWWTAKYAIGNNYRIYEQKIDGTWEVFGDPISAKAIAVDYWSNVWVVKTDGSLAVWEFFGSGYWRSIPKMNNCIDIAGGIGDTKYGIYVTGVWYKLFFTVTENIDNLNWLHQSKNLTGEIERVDSAPETWNVAVKTKDNRVYYRKYYDDNFHSAGFPPYAIDVACTE